MTIQTATVTGMPWVLNSYPCCLSRVISAETLIGVRASIAISFPVEYESPRCSGCVAVRWQELSPNSLLADSVWLSRQAKQTEVSNGIQQCSSHPFWDLPPTTVSAEEIPIDRPAPLRGARISTIAGATSNSFGEFRVSHRVNGSISFGTYLHTCSLGCVSKNGLAQLGSNDV